MNVYFIVVWCTIVSGCLSVPRQRNKHVKYSVDKLHVRRDVKNHTALEILEKNLMRKSKPIKNKRNRDITASKSTLSSIPGHILNYETNQTSLSVNEVEFSMNGCLTSFGAKSPLCRPRKSIDQSIFNKRSYESEQNFIVSTTVASVKKPTIDDFFGLFTQDTLTSRDLSKKNYESPSHNFTNKKFQTTPSPYPVSDRLINEKNAIEKSIDSYKPVFDYSHKFVTTHKTRLLPAESKLLSDTQMLYLDFGKPNDGKFYQKFEDEGGTPGGGGDVETENHIESTSEETPGHSSTEIEIQVAESEEVPSHTHFEEPQPSHSTTHEKENERDVEDELDLGSPNEAKRKCQLETKKKCVCSFVSVIASIHKMVTSAVGPKTVLNQASHLNCSQYIPKPDTFNLNPFSKPKVLSASKKPMAVDGGKGPKEIEEHSLSQFIMESVDDEDDEVHIFVNTDVKIPCFPTSDVHLSASGADHVQYKWTHGNKQAITDGRITENSDGDGTLLIEAATLADSANYTCDVDYVNPDTGRRTDETFTHPLAVVTLPTVTTRAALHLRSTGACDAGLLEMFELYLPQQVEAALCGGGDGDSRLCSVELHSPACHSGSTGESMEVSVSLEVYIHRQAERAVAGGGGSNSSGPCDPKCHLVLTLRLLQIFKESLREIAMTPVTSKLDNGGSRKFTPVGNVNIKYIFGCIGGYHLDGGFCVACPKHTYSEDGDTECSECPAHTYQSSVGARRCIPCSVAWIPACNEYLESQNLFMIVGVVGLVVALLGGFAIWYIVSVKQKKFTDVKKLVIETPLTKKKKVKFGKTQKSIRKKLKEKTELQPLLESSTDGESISDSAVSKVNEKRKKKRNNHFVETSEATSL